MALSLGIKLWRRRIRTGEPPVPPVVVPTYLLTAAGNGICTAKGTKIKLTTSD